MLALQFLFGDIARIRTIINQTWQDYRAGAYDLVAVSVTTDAALGFVRQMEDDFFKTFPKASSFEELYQGFYLAQCLMRGEDPDTRLKRGDDMNFAMYDVSTNFFFPTYIVLSAFNDIVSPREIPSYKPGFYGTYIPSSDRSRKNAREKFLEDKLVLVEICPYLSALAVGTRGSGMPAEDELVRGFGNMIYSNNITLSNLFNVQTLLDIHHVMREDVQRGYESLCTDARCIETTIRENLRFHENLTVQNWPKSNDRGLHSILERIGDWVKTDCVKEALVRMVSHKTVSYIR